MNIAYSKCTMCDLMERIISKTKTSKSKFHLIKLILFRDLIKDATRDVKPKKIQFITVLIKLRFSVILHVILRIVSILNDIDFYRAYKKH